MPAVFQLLLLIQVPTNHNHRSQELQEIVEQIDMAATFVKIGGFGRLIALVSPGYRPEKVQYIHTQFSFSEAFQEKCARVPLPFCCCCSFNVLPAPQASIRRDEMLYRATVVNGTRHHFSPVCGDLKNGTTDGLDVKCQS